MQLEPVMQSLRRRDGGGEGLQSSPVEVAQRIVAVCAGGIAGVAGKLGLALQV